MAYGEEMNILIGEEVRIDGRLGIIIGVSGNWLEIQLYGGKDTVWAELHEITFVRYYVYAKS